ncbi:hypothetical protein E4T42_09686 [Aureobasidium subglaciale]|nr:hypothetical protein E4T42_09686 [Aureobasidium subglaciale]
MPPKRATKTAAKAAPATTAKTPATRGTRSRAQKATPPQEEQPEEEAEVITTVRSTRSRKSTNVEQDSPTQEEEAAISDAMPQPRTKQRPLTRGRPPRTVKKPAPSKANKGAMDNLKARMEEDRRATKAGLVTQSVPESQSQQAERAIREATNNDGDAALVPARPARPAPRSPSPARHTAVPGTAVKAPASVARPQSAVKMQSTPGAESSVLALQNFRRRARQPSLLQMVQNPELVAASPIDDTTDFTLGSLGDEDDFAPHDESTPLQVSKSKPVDVEQEVEEAEEGEEQQKAQTPEAALPDSDDEFYGATPQKTSQRQTRKRKSDAIDDSEVQVTRSSPSLPSPSRSIAEPEEYEAIPATAPDDDEEEAATTESQQERLLSDTYADPMSSSPPPEPISPTSPEHHRQTPALSPSAIRKSARAGGQPKKIKPLTTATLRAMLPKRRAQRKDEFDFTSSSAHEASSSAFEDERRKKAKTKKPTAPKKTPVAKAKKPATTAATSKRTSRTYGRSNKENDPVHISSGSSSLSELNSDDLEADETADTSLDTIKGAKSDDKVSDELRKAREKFMEVDDWEMEFESASIGVGDASSPWR